MFLTHYFTVPESSGRMIHRNHKKILTIPVYSKELSVSSRYLGGGQEFPHRKSSKCNNYFRINYFFRFSQSPGPSPIKRILASGSPTPKTRFVSLFLRGSESSSSIFSFNF